MVYRYRPKRYKAIYIILTVAVLIIALTLIFQYGFRETKIEIPNLLVLPELSTFGYVEVSVNAVVTEGEGVITLTGECYQLSAFTEAVQAESIVNGLAKKISFRPNTHDLMKDAFDNFEIEVVMVKITELRNNTFISKLVLKQENRIISLDSRPSDAIALAVRTDAPVYIKEDLMRSHGKFIC